MELKHYIAGIRETEIFALEERIILAKKRLEFLVDYTSMSPAEMRINSEAFNWHSRMPPIFEEHEEIIGASKRQAENALKLRRDRFVEELDGYNKQLEEFETFGDVSEVNRYLKKAQTLNSRLEAAQEKVRGLVFSGRNGVSIFRRNCINLELL
eukprot:sb/3473311/